MSHNTNFSGPSSAQYEYLDSNSLLQISCSEGDFQGCPVGIIVQNGVVKHSQQFQITTPTVRSYRNGIKIGCTFVTNEAFKKLHEWHERFLYEKVPVTHQP